MNEEWDELPEGWERANLAEVCEPIVQVNPERTPKRKFKYVDISSINNGSHEIVETKEFIGEDAPSRARKPIKSGDVLFATVRPYLKNIAQVPSELDGQVASTGFCVLRAGPKIDPRYLFRFVLADEFVQHVTEAQRGISYPAVTDRDLYSSLIAYPPFPEQHRIVEKIERLLAESRTAREALDRVPALLKRFRQTVLAKAFRGELIERDPSDEPASMLLERIREERRWKWDEPHGSPAVALRAGKAGDSATAARTTKGAKGKKYVEPEPPDTSDLPELPEGWCWAIVGDVIDLLQYGTSVKADSNEKSGIPVLRMGNIQDGQIDVSDLKFIDPAKDDIPKYLLTRNDILINRTNSPELVGKAAHFDADGNYIFASYLIRLLVNPKAILPQYLVWVINSEIGRRHIATVKHQVAGQANINSQNIRDMPVPLAPLAEQRRIVAKIETLFAQADAIERAAEVARRRAGKVDQAVLARAFRGEL